MSEKEIKQEPMSIDLAADVNQSWEDKARIQEAELNHEFRMEKLDFDRERYENARPKSDKELELEYAYKNRQLDRQIAREQYERTFGYKAEKYGTTGGILLAIFGFFAWIIKKAGE